MFQDVNNKQRRWRIISSEFFLSSYYLMNVIS